MVFKTIMLMLMGMLLWSIFEVSVIVSTDFCINHPNQSVRFVDLSCEILLEEGK